MNLFTSDDFLNAIADIYFPGKNHQIKLFKVDGKFFRLLVIDSKQIITRFPFLDYHEAITAKNKIKAEKLSFLPQAVLAINRYDDILKLPVNNDPAIEYAPFIELSNFKNGEGFLGFLDSRDHDLIANTNRRIRKLTREVGQVNYEFKSQDKSTIDKCIDWKSLHYDKFGSTDLFFDRRHSKFFKLLQDKGILVVSTLSASDRLIAVNIGARYDNNYYGSICAYDRNFSQYAPGRLLLHFLIAECIKRKFKQFDFLVGDEGYKWKYITHYRVIGMIGKPPISHKIYQFLLKTRYIARSKFPGIYYWLKKLVINAEKLLQPRK